MDISHRKVSKRIRFTDASGNPITGREISIKQKNHAFLFGCGGFDFIPYVMKGEEDRQRIKAEGLAG